MRKISLEVGGVPGGNVKTWAYPAGQDLGIFLIPSYKFRVRGTTDADTASVTEFDVLRFGISCKDGRKATVVGLADKQTHVIKGWVPSYRVHSANSPENGAWRVYDNFLIHDGPDHAGELFASIGCVEIMGPSGFVKFNNLLIALAGLKGLGRDAALRRIGNSGQISITYQAAVRPPLLNAP